MGCPAAVARRCSYRRNQLLNLWSIPPAPCIPSSFTPLLHHQIRSWNRWFPLTLTFDRDFGIFLAFLEKNRLAAPRVNQCEVTYVNHILTGKGWERYGDLEKIFTFWRSPDATPPGPPEDLRLHTRFIIPGDAGKPIGRLHVDLQPAIRVSDSLPMYVLHLTARGQVGDGLAFFDLGREWIVKTFKRLTTESVHNIWRIKNHAGCRNC